ncbi:carboxynorspermidine decarboxylase [Halosquirtibacter laminarini]|uniref:Carboxynorspermidine decarboxylase n=1 Tax=Halosquirtibacter laminarini TaxID=3374600 RepID=A0AC61NLL9_9BACT|nr:carboxynorspermidine decarboxylase [Prolixibacteraceae bacterium]
MKRYNVDYPSFVLEEGLLKSNIQRIDEIQKRADIKILLALKAFSTWPVFDLFRGAFDSCTASGPWEAKLGHTEMGALSHTYSPAYCDRDFQEVMDHSSHIIFNSISQFDQFYDRIKLHSHPISIGLRVNPGYSPVKTDLYNPCAAESRLGMVASSLPDELPNGVEGLHFHALCESNSFDLEKILFSFEKLYAKYLPNIKWVNMGGGHLITHNDYDGDHLISVLKAFKERWGVKVYLEPGSAFAWQTGVLVANVVDVINHPDKKTAILDVSFTAHMPDCLEMPYQPEIRGAKTEQMVDGYCYKMGGNSCLAGDVLGDWWFDHLLKIGEQIIFEDMIHYTTVKTTFFNGVKHPDLVIEGMDGHLKVLRHFTYEDFKSKLG